MKKKKSTPITITITVLTWWFGEAPNLKSRQTMVGFRLTTARNSGGNVIKYDPVYIRLICSIWARDKDLLVFRSSLRGSAVVGVGPSSGGGTDDHCSESRTYAFGTGRSTVDAGVATGGDRGVAGEGGGGAGSKSAARLSVSGRLSDRDDIGGNADERKCCAAALSEPRDTLCTVVAAKESSDIVGAVVAIEPVPSNIADATAAGELPDAAERPGAAGTAVAGERTDTVAPPVTADESPDSSDWHEWLDSVSTERPGCSSS